MKVILKNSSLVFQKATPQPVLVSETARTTINANGETRSEASTNNYVLKLYNVQGLSKVKVSGNWIGTTNNSRAWATYTDEAFVAANLVAIYSGSSSTDVNNPVAVNDIITLNGVDYIAIAAYIRSGYPDLNLTVETYVE